QALRIGSSSARRRLPVHEFLRRHLPRTLTEPRVQMLNLRGAVDQRLQRLCIDPADRDALDGVVLALAGLSRLWKDPDGRAAIEPVLERARWMVLPLSECPAAPGQGALAVECRASDPALRNALATLHDPVTAAAVEQELDASAALPDKQRSRFAATALPHNRLGAVMFARHRDRRQLFWNRPPRPSWAIAWDGDGWNPVFRRLPLERSRLERPALFIAHWRAAPELPGPDPRTRIWTSGVESWRRLAEHGLWVEGCADHLGFESILPTLNCAVLRLPSLSDWAVLTHEAAVESWAGSGVGQVIASYRLDAGAPPDGDQLSNLRAATHFYWSSPQQYRALAPFPGADAVHACGAGKTADVLCELGIEPVIFPNRSEWRRWLS
ncbi:MAG TPA: hypothetical protein ENK16_02805, partial [Chromatiales bacterium]|nr:hypothetical protein [Chromatiales bacterium]